MELEIQNSKCWKNSSKFIFNSWRKKCDYNHNAIEINEQRLITAYDIYETMLDMTGLNEIKYKSGYRQTLFKEITEKRNVLIMKNLI